MNPRRLRANGLEFTLLEAGVPAPGEHRPLLLCLHGFPDNAQSFDPLLEHFAAAGWWAVAPFQRGYAPTAIPADGDYRASTLARDAIALIDHLGAERAVLLGHDWGAVQAYLAAALRPDRIAGIVTAAVPHLRRFFLRMTAAQFHRSRYMLRFQWPGIEKRLVANGRAELRALASSWSPALDVDRALASVWNDFADPVRLKAALSYYRALPGGLLTAELWRLIVAPTPVPAHVISGAQDGCIAAAMFTDQAHLFAAGFGESVMAGAGHFMHLEQPEAFVRIVLDAAAPMRP